MFVDWYVCRLASATGYMAFGQSGSSTSAQMSGADVFVAYVENSNVVIADYIITAKQTVWKNSDIQQICSLTDPVIVDSFTVFVNTFPRSAISDSI